MNTALAVIGQTQKPPLNKNELLKASAEAIRRKQSAAREKSWTEQRKIIAKRNEILIALAKKQIASAETYVGEPRYDDDKYCIKFEVRLESVPEEVNTLSKQAEAIATPRVETYQEILSELRAAAALPDRTAALLDDKELANRLAEAGELLRCKSNAKTIAV